MDHLIRQFEKFHEENPHVYREVVKLAFDMHNRGMTRVSMDFIYHVARWEVIKATNNIDYKLNDHFTAFYSRLIMHDHPELEGFFETRKSQADKWMANRGKELRAAA